MENLVSFGQLSSIVDYIVKRLKSDSCPYRVGDILQTESVTDPSVSWPGTSWQKIRGVFLFAESDSHNAGQTGGEENHTLTLHEMPIHNHDLRSREKNAGTATYSHIINNSDLITADWYYPLSDSINNAGGNQPHNNMPPYKAVYMWKRIS